MATSAKALALAQSLADSLKRRLTLAVTLSFDADQNPLIRVGTGVAGTDGGLIKVSPIDWPLAKDVLGLDSPVYTPHVIKVCFEAAKAIAGPAISNPVTWKTRLALLAEAAVRGTRLEVFESDADSAPASSDMVAGKLRAAQEASPEYGMVQSQ
ncbi:hypothetical protein EBZ39_09885 [bacterium]|nr:hypothetical protein [bacterium]